MNEPENKMPGSGKGQSRLPLESADNPGGEPSTGVEDIGARKLGTSVSSRVDARPDDAYAEIFVSEDWMSAVADLNPPRGDGAPFRPECFSELFARLGVTNGIRWNEIHEAIDTCNLERKSIHDLVVALGNWPKSETPEHLELEDRFGKNETVPFDGASRVDYRSLSSLAAVKKGDRLARILPAFQGETGLDIRGDAVPIAKASVATFVPGKNTVCGDSYLESSVDGLLAINGNRLDIEEILLIKGDVDALTGHIVFPGDVVIEGRVADGFKVWAGGSVVCKETLDAFDVNVKKNVLCAQGVVGRKKGQLRAGGELRAKFVQDCTVVTRGDAIVSNAIVNSRMYTLGKIDLGENGIIMGGELYAVHGLRCGRLGDVSRTKTVIHAGTDFTVRQQLDQANERLRILALKARKAAEAQALRPGIGLDRLRLALDRSIVDLAAIVGRLLLSLDADEGAVIEAYGDIFPGVLIEICCLHLEIEKPLRASRFRLDKAAGHIVVESLRP